MTEHLSIRNGKLYYYNTPIAFVDEYDRILVADSTFKTKELDSHLQKEWNVRWVENIFSELTSPDKEKIPPIKSVRIWFLQDEIDSRYKFIPYQTFVEIGGGALTIADYITVFDSTFPSNNLDEIYTDFQLGKVEGYSARQLAMGDLIELYDHMEWRFYYIDKVGFKEVVLQHS